MKVLDVLCIGQAAYDIILQVDHHPREDEKCTAHARWQCGGGPAANAAVAVSRLGGKSALIAYLGKDAWGNLHWRELKTEKVDREGVVRGDEGTPLSVILVKPDGSRTVINHRPAKAALAPQQVNLRQFTPRVILTDGHEPQLGKAVVNFAREGNIPVVLDAGSLHSGTRQLAPQVDYLIASQKFARQFSGENEPMRALSALGRIAPTVIITLGENGLIWKRGKETGSFPAYSVNVIDTTGAGDAFHGAFALGLARGYTFGQNIRYSSMVAALTCTQMGARLGIPFRKEVEKAFSERDGFSND